MKKTEIFRDIVDIMTNDYAGFSEKKHVNRPDNYVITDDMDEIEFVQTIQSYLLDFKDGHLIFNMKNNRTPFKGFRGAKLQIFLHSVFLCFFYLRPYLLDCGFVSLVSATTIEVVTSYL